MFGSVVNTISPAAGGVITDAKKTSVSTLRTASAVGATTLVPLLKLRSRPFKCTTTLFGPTSASVSGGKAPVSVGPVTALKDGPIVWAATAGAAMTLSPASGIGKRSASYVRHGPSGIFARSG